MPRKNVLKVAVVLALPCLFSASANAQQENTQTPRETAAG